MAKIGITTEEVLTTRDFSQMMVYERELNLMDKAAMIETLTAVERLSSSKKVFELQVKLNNDDQVFTITNARHSPRRWANLNTLVDFIKALCPNLVTDRFGAGDEVLHVKFGINPVDT